MLNDVLADLCADTLVIECCVVRNSVRVHKKTVISDDGDTGILCLCLNVYKSVRVDSCDNKAVSACSDHVLDL